VPELDVQGRSIFYERRGEGEPLVLIMGLSGNSTNWGEPFLSLLERDFDVVALDNRGMGRSGPADEDFTIADMAGDTAGLLAALGLHAAHVMGISMGGMIAQQLTLSSPGLVRALVLGCTYAGGPGSRLTDPAVVQSLAEPMLEGDREGAIRAAWAVNVSAAYARDEQAFARFRELALTHPPPLPAIMRQMQAVAGHDVSGRLAEIQAPTLVLHGTEDRMLDVGNGRLIAAAVPGARLEIFEGVGHLFFWEQPERSARLVRDFLFEADRRAVAAAPDVA
jgi:pimeloyl-ACP methyl ester carboxylesterase